MSRYTPEQLSDMAKHMRGRNLSKYYEMVIIHLAHRFRMSTAEVAIRIDDMVIE